METVDVYETIYGPVKLGPDLARVFRQAKRFSLQPRWKRFFWGDAEKMVMGEAYVAEEYMLKRCKMADEEGRRIGFAELDPKHIVKVDYV